MPTPSLLDRLIPRRLDNDYRGHPIALWFFVAITLMTLGRSLVHVFRADGGAQSIATIPLERMSGGGSEAVITIFALWGLSQLLLGILYVIALWRYRALIPLLYLLLAVEYFGRFAIAQWKPLPTLDTPPGANGNLIFMVATPILMALALRNHRSAPSDAPDAAERSVA